MKTVHAEKEFCATELMSLESGMNCSYPINSISSCRYHTQLQPVEFHAPTDTSPAQSSSVCPPLLKSVKLASSLREFTSEEIELAILMHALNGHSTRYMADSSGLSYITGNSLAALAAHRNYDSRMKPWYVTPERLVEAIGTRFDKSV